MDESHLAEQFEAHRPHLHGVAYRMLGSLSEADDAVQEAWLRLSRSDAGSIVNLGGWLTTVVARICLDLLRARAARRETPLSAYVPDGLVSRAEHSDPEQLALLADGIGLALLVVLHTLTPAERLAFVLHDLFAVPFDQIAPILGRSPTATRKLASRARSRVRGATTLPDADLTQQQSVVEAFLAASREGDFARLLAVLDPDVVLRLDRGATPADASRELRGAEAVIAQGFRFAGPGWTTARVVVNAAAGLVISRGGQPMAVVGFTVRRSLIVAIDMLADPARLARLDLAAFAD
jgi:RNA polymerase sigma factor (sigma-70 family)